MGLEDLKKQAEEGFEKAKETIGEENVEKIVEVAKDKATEVASGLKDKFQKSPDGKGSGPRSPVPFHICASLCPIPYRLFSPHLQRFLSPTLFHCFVL